MPMSDKAKEEGGEKRLFQKVEPGVMKTQAQGGYSQSRKSGPKQGAYASLRLKVRMIVEYAGNQNLSPFWHNNYFERKAIEK